MAPKRSLPDGRNPLLEPEHTPPLEILVERRRLGQTDLTVKPGQIGITNASRAENLGIFDYAHLRVPLPKDLHGSGIFSLQRNGTYPESYFLMRRSTDGYISATGMFKAAFPWASAEEEQTERKHHKTFITAGPEEVAGNVWISPNEALKLADEYRIRPWIIALLDPEPIEIGTKDKDRSSISTPPKFNLSDKDKLFAPPSSMPTTKSPRKRDLRSASPTKSPRKVASPRKRAPRATSVAKSDVSEVMSEPAKKVSKALQNLTNGASATPSTATEDVVRIEVDETVDREADIETTHTTVKVEMPASHPDLPLPKNTEDMIAKAKEIVEEATKLEEKKKRGRPSKRKAGDAELAEREEAEAGEGSEAAPIKKVRMAETLKKERVRSRALIALTASVAIGAVIPYFL